MMKYKCVQKGNRNGNKFELKIICEWNEIEYKGNKDEMNMNMIMVWMQWYKCDYGNWSELNLKWKKM